VKRKVCIITRILTPESWNMKDEEIEGAIRLYLKPEDIPSCKHTEKVTVLSEAPQAFLYEEKFKNLKLRTSPNDMGD